MLNAILTGISIGLGLAISIGPYFLLLVNTSIAEGKVSARYLALGVALNDVVYLIAAYLSANFILRHASFIDQARGFAGFFILAFGIYTVLKKPYLNSNATTVLKPIEKIKNVAKGFAFNGLNPSVFIFWFATTSLLISKTNFSKNQTLVMFISVVCTTVTSDLIKVHLAQYFSHHFTEKNIKKINRIVGSVLIVVAIALLIKTFLL